MNRRVIVPLVVLLGLVGIGSLLEYTGRLGARSGTGRAAGLSGYAGGCAGSVADLPPELAEQLEIGDALPKAEKSTGPEEASDDSVIPGEYIIKFKSRLAIGAPPRVGPTDILGSGNDELDGVLTNLPGFAMSGLLERAEDFEQSDEIGLDHAFLVETDLDPTGFYDRLRHFQEIEWVEPVRRINALGAPPNDPYYAYQWHMSLAGAHVAWDTADGTGTVVAVIDTGVSAGPDGIGKLVPGFDFIDNDANPAGGNGHGTHVAGTIAQTTNNADGVAGLAPGASIMPIRVLGDNGEGTTDGVAQGIIWAVDQGAHIINLSLGGADYSQVLTDAIDYAESNGVLVVAASGNDYYTDFVSFPGSLPNTIAVGATGMNDLSPYSNQGPELDMVAPGGDLSTDDDGDGYPDGVLQETRVDGEVSYWFFEGTSMATPHVAAAAAVLHSAGVTDAVDLRTLLVQNADDMNDAGWDSATGFGSLNLLASIDAISDLNAPDEDNAGDEPSEDDNEQAADEAPAPGSPQAGDTPEIWGVKVNLLNPYTATIRWRTSAPGTTEFEGLDGKSAISKEPTVRHAIVVHSEREVDTYVTLISRFREPSNSMSQKKVPIPFASNAE